MENLTDMTLFEAFCRETPCGSIYDNDLPSGHLDHNVHTVSGFETTWRLRNLRRVRIKRARWVEANGLLVPYLHRAKDGGLVRALSLHFQSGAKRKIRRFNPLPSSSSVILRKWYLNHIVFPSW